MVYNGNSKETEESQPIKMSALKYRCVNHVIYNRDTLYTTFPDGTKTWALDWATADAALPELFCCEIVGCTARPVQAIQYVDSTQPALAAVSATDAILADILSELKTHTAQNERALAGQQLMIQETLYRLKEVRDIERNAANAANAIAATKGVSKA